MPNKMGELSGCLWRPSELHLRMEDPLNAGHHVVVLDELPALQLRQAFLDLRSEPRVMVAVGFHQLLHKLLRVASGLRCKAVELVLEFRREVDFHSVTLPPFRKTNPPFPHP